jgi:S-methylmethionine-dependent homocysteine/selenocysteine methylase
MSRYRTRLPHVDEQLFVTDGGLETTLIYHEHVDLPHFAAFPLLDRREGRAVLDRYFERYAGLARAAGVGAVLESATWRANPDWGAKLGYDARALDAIQRRAIGQLVDIRARYETAQTPIVISGNLGPRGDGYGGTATMGAAEAADYHGAQVRSFAATQADMVAAFTMTYAEEAIGIAQAAKASGMPVALSFTVETDGRLPSGEALGDAIMRTDAATGAYPRYYMINCAHPSHFRAVLERGEAWRGRVRGLRANASRRSHAELDAMTDLDAGDPDELASDYRALQPLLPRLAVVGGCCGTDHRHVGAICRALRGGSGHQLS